MVPDRFWRLAGDFITYVQAFGVANGSGFPGPAELRSRLTALLEPLARGGPAGEVDEARFALITWADEVILKTTWPGQNEWLREPLQMRLLHTNKGGDLFFDHLARLRPEQLAVREIYYLALAFGFEGKLQGAPQERLKLIDDQYKILRSANRLKEPHREELLSPDAYELDVELPREAGSRLLRGLLFLALGMTVFYGALWIALALIGSEVPVPRGL